MANLKEVAAEARFTLHKILMDDYITGENSVMMLTREEASRLAYEDVKSLSVSAIRKRLAGMWEEIEEANKTGA